MVLKKDKSKIITIYIYLRKKVNSNKIITSLSFGICPYKLTMHITYLFFFLGGGGGGSVELDQDQHCFSSQD